MISTDTPNIKLSPVARFTPLASAPMAFAVTLFTTVRKKRNSPSLVRRRPLPPPPQIFLTCHFPPPAHTDLLLSDRVSVLLDFPLLPSSPFSLPSLVIILLLPPALSHLLHRPLLPPALTLLTFSPMPSWRWTLPLKLPLPTSTSPPWVRPLQPIPGLHSCPHRTLATLHVGCPRLAPLP